MHVHEQRNRSSLIIMSVETREVQKMSVAEILLTWGVILTTLLVVVWIKNKQGY